MFAVTWWVCLGGDMKEQETVERRCCLDADRAWARLKLTAKVLLPQKGERMWVVGAEQLQISERR